MIYLYKKIIFRKEKCESRNILHFFFHTLLVTLALMPAEWLYEKLLTEFEVQHELMILTVTGMS